MFLFQSIIYSNHEDLRTSWLKPHLLEKRAEVLEVEGGKGIMDTVVKGLGLTEGDL